MAEKKGRFIIQEVKDRNSPQMFPKRYDSFSINKKVTIKSLGSYHNASGVNRNLSFVCDLVQGRWVSISQLWNNTMILFPGATQINFKQMRTVLKQPLKERLFVSSNEDKDDQNNNSHKKMTLTTLNNKSQPFPTIEEVDNETHTKPKTMPYSQSNNNKKFGFNKQKTLAYPQSEFKAKTQVIFKSRIKKRKMTRTEEHSSLNHLNEEFHKKISDQNRIRLHPGGNSFQIGQKPFWFITSNTFSLIQSLPTKQAFQNLVICPIDNNKDTSRPSDKTK